MTSTQVLEELQEQTRALAQRAEEIARMPQVERRRSVLKEVAQAGKQLLQRSRDLVSEREQALRRVALVEEGDPVALLAELDLARRCECELAGRVSFVLGTQARREGRQQAARNALEEASLLCDGGMQVDAYRQLGELHLKGEKRTHYHAARGIYFLLEHDQRDLRKAAGELKEARSLEEANLLAAFGTGCLLEIQGETAKADRAFLEVLARSRRRGDQAVAQAYERLRQRLRSFTTYEEVRDLAVGLMGTAAGHVALEPRILLEAFRHPAIDPGDRKRLRLALTEPLTAFAHPATRPADASDRQLRTWQAARLQVLLELAADESLEAASERAEQGNLPRLDEVPQGTTQGAIVARLLSQLWSLRAREILDGELEFPSMGERMAAYVQASDQEVRWLAAAVEQNVNVDCSYAVDLELLIENLTRMWETVSEEPMDPASLLSLIPSEELQAKIESTLDVLFATLARRGVGWKELDYCQRLELIVSSVGKGQELTEFGLGELRSTLLERLLRLGDPRVLLHARVELAKLYANQHRYDAAIEHARAAVELDGKNADAAYWLGVIYLRCGKRLLGLDGLRMAAERFGHPAANAALAEDCARDDQPHFASQYFIHAAENALRRPSVLTPDDLREVRHWLHRALVENQNVKDFAIVLDKRLARKERKAKRKELEDLNARRRDDQGKRAERILELEKRLKEVRTMLERGKKR